MRNLVVASLIVLAGCGQKVPLHLQYLESLAEGDATKASELFCAKSPDNRINELQQVVEWELIEEGAQEFGGTTLATATYSVTNQLGDTARYMISMADAADIEGLIQWNNREYGYTDTYDPDDYQQRGKCLAATVEVD
ncbi:lipoprotein [Leptothoe kymatousa]|uniref:Lipoprotein n=1 Tax=Leptothoe kymatousa TAU-MAC 1615 TaxID=2364775 RepID=A0ABS5Y429_9CYAN|nr:lipoprotein [Leptothoe kymatousa]MBT9312546.1 lipoprotein [Leptothoe kymatousa TAU-MAC 1615]